MKFLRYILPLVFALSAPLIAAEKDTNPSSDYERAVKVYVDAAGEQLNAVHAQVEAMAAVPPVEESKKRMEKVTASLAECDQLLADLKKAGPQDFDKVKMKFEQTRAVMLKALEASRKG